MHEGWGAVQRKLTACSLAGVTALDTTTRRNCSQSQRRKFCDKLFLKRHFSPHPRPRTATAARRPRSRQQPHDTHAQKKHHTIAHNAEQSVSVTTQPTQQQQRRRQHVGQNRYATNRACQIHRNAAATVCRAFHPGRRSAVERDDDSAPHIRAGRRGCRCAMCRIGPRDSPPVISRTCAPEVLCVVGGASGFFPYSSCVRHENDCGCRVRDCWLCFFSSVDPTCGSVRGCAGEIRGVFGVFTVF